MAVTFELDADIRHDVGKGASRRLRRAGKVPAILYGAKQSPESLLLDHVTLAKQLENEAFYSHILTIKVGERSERAILRDLQRHPYKVQILHVDLQRVSADQKIRVRVPLHFTNQDIAKGVKQQGGIISHMMNDVEVSVLPDDLPEYIEVDMADIGLNEAVHLSQIRLPKGVELVQLAHGDDATVASIHHPRAEAEETPAGVEAAPSATPGAAPTPAPE